MTSRGRVGDTIDIVKMSDGGLTSVDNTRLHAAKRAGIDVHAQVHGDDDAILMRTRRASIAMVEFLQPRERRS